METIAILAAAAASVFVLWAAGMALWFRPYTTRGYRPRSKPKAPASVPPHRFRSDRSTTMRGAALVGFRQCGTGLATMTCDPEWAEITALGSRSVWIDRASVTRVRLLKGGPFFETADGDYDGVLFRGGARPLLPMQALAHYGWPVVAPDRSNP